MSNVIETKKLVVLPRNVSDAIELLRKEPAWSNERIIRMAMPGECAVYVGTCVGPIRSVPFDTLMDALINGYEVEKTAEEIAEEARQEADRKRKAAEARIASRYRHKRTWLWETCFRDTETACTNYMDGMRYVLDALDIKIPEVNA